MDRQPSIICFVQAQKLHPGNPKQKNLKNFV